MAIFNSYASLPEGMGKTFGVFLHQGSLYKGDLLVQLHLGKICRFYTPITARWFLHLRIPENRTPQIYII